MCIHRKNSFNNNNNNHNNHNHNHNEQEFNGITVIVSSRVSPFFDNKTTQLESRFYSSKTTFKFILPSSRAVP
jgi:hypothetical protein